MIIFEDATKKKVQSKDYNYIFNKETGFFARWGKTKEDDPQMAPSPEILDIEITTKCDGVGGKLCPFCYKSNTPNGKNMSFETFKKMIDKFPIYMQRTCIAEDNGKTTKRFVFSMPAEINEENDKKMEAEIEAKGLRIVGYVQKPVHFLNQVAFGADSKAKSNPDLWKMMDYCRTNGIIPNITVAEINDETADKLVEKCGAVAVSRVYISKNPIKLKKLKKISSFI